MRPGFQRANETANETSCHKWTEYSKWRAEMAESGVGGSGSLPAFDQPAIKLVGEGLAVFGAEVGGTAADVAAAAELVEDVSHRQPLADVSVGIELAPRINGLGPFGHRVGGKRNVRGDHQVTRRGQLNDPS